MPGWITLQRILSLANWIASDFVSEISPPLAAGLLDARDRLTCRGRVDVAHDHPRALLGEEHCGLTSHAHARARDERDLSGQPAAHRPPPARSSASAAPKASTTPCMSRGVRVPMVTSSNPLEVARQLPVG